MKNTDLYLKKLLKKSINETLEEKANKMMGKIREYEMGEGFDSPEIKSIRGGEDFNYDEFKKIRFPREKFKGFDDDSITQDELDYRESMRDFEDEYGQEPYIDDETEYYLSDDDDDEDDDEEFEDDDIETIMEGEMCEQCGSGEMREGECMECGSKSMYESSAYDLNPKNKFDFMEDEDELVIACKEARRIASLPGADKASKDFAESECDKAGMDLNESKKLVGKQRKLDKNKNNKLDAEDFKLLRKSKKQKYEVDEEEMEEGNEFSGELEKARKAGKKTFKVDGKTYPVKESIEYHILDNEGDIIRLNENELIDLIENIVKEEKSMGKPKGLVTYEKAHKESGKGNKEYMKSLGTKMKDYLKDGSKGKFDMNPKTFPQGNGELGKMNKKAFKLTDELEDFNYEIAGQQFPIPDEIGYDEKRMEKYFKGDSTTGNAPGGNALDSKTNDRFNKMRKKNTLKKIKDQSYKRVPQPTFNETSTDEDGKLNIKLETIDERKINILNEEFERMKELVGYNRKTQ
jgi:hypothetical protein